VTSAPCSQAPLRRWPRPPAGTAMLVAALATEGSVRRSRAASDRRGATAEPTDTGRERSPVRRACTAGVHTARVCGLMSGIDQGRAEQLSRLPHDGRPAIPASATRGAGGTQA